MGTINIEFAAIVFAAACVASCALVCLVLERRYAARVAALEKRERELALREANEGTDLPIALHKWITRSARIVLKNFPITANEREMMAASATIGALLNINDMFGKAINAYIETAGMDGSINDAPIYGPGTAEFKATDDDEFAADDDDDELPDISDKDSDPGTPILQ